MRPSLGLLLAVALLAGCATPTLPGVSPLATRAMEPLGGLDFKPLTAANAPYMGGVPVGAGMGPVPAPASVPSASPLSSGGAMSGNVFGGYYGYSYYGGGSTVPMALISISEAEAPGSRGPLKRILEDVVAPVLEDWAPDAHLVGSNGALGSDGLALTPSPAPSSYPGYQDPYAAGWRLSYISPSRQEALNFTVMADKTVAIRMRWAPLNLATAPIGVDADEAVKALTAAIESADAKSEEEKSGLDYFLGTPFATPAPMPQAPPGMAPPYQERIEPIYDVPEGARWNVQLQSVLGKLVWELNFHQPYVNQPQPMPMMTPSDHYVDQSGRGMVDAQTGAVIRFSRPSKRYFPQPFPPKPMPDMPSPMPLPVPSGTMPPSPPPPPAVAPSVMPSA